MPAAVHGEDGVEHYPDSMEPPISVAPSSNRTDEVPDGQCGQEKKAGELHAGKKSDTTADRQNLRQCLNKMGSVERHL